MNDRQQWFAPFYFLRVAELVIDLQSIQHHLFQI